ncbi:putative chloroperoxidase [Xylariaceae sp. FL0804]|nr:putative chloroperoxidase [Xylariaceae sp. FL0804]
MQALVLLALAAASQAFPQPSIKPWVAPTKTDSRSPCPLLNTLANHGYLPHDGRQITIDQIAGAILEALNWSTDFGTGPADAAFAGLGNVTAIDLDQLDAMPAGQHDASLTRLDTAEGNSLVLNEPRLDALLADSPASSAFLDVASLARSRDRVEALSPALEATPETIAHGEASLLLTLMLATPVPPAADNVTAAEVARLGAPKDRVAAWLREERLPVAQGWHPSVRQVQTADLDPFTDAISASMVAQDGAYGAAGSHLGVGPYEDS